MSNLDTIERTVCDRPVRGPRFAEQVVVVTGAARGIGAAVAAAFDAEGAAVAMLDIDVEGARRRAADMRRGVAIACDVSDSDAVAEAFGRVADELGAVDVVVSNAGIPGSPEEMARLAGVLERHSTERVEGGAQPTPMEVTMNVTDEQWRRLLAVHLDGTFYVTRAALAVMVPRRRGAIVNMASICGVTGCLGAPAYSAAKAGIIGLTRAVAKEVAPHRVRVNAVAPGHIDTAFNRSRSSKHRELVVAATPLARLGLPDEVADTVLFLASDEASFYVGAVLGPNGGLVMA
jgi:3-oxoacyl-[acyl-carrier protein] reductase